MKRIRDALARLAVRAWARLAPHEFERMMDDRSALESLGEYAYDGGAWSSVPTMVRTALVKAGEDPLVADRVRDLARWPPRMIRNTARVR